MAYYDINTAGIFFSRLRLLQFMLVSDKRRNTKCSTRFDIMFNNLIQQI